VDAVGFAFKLYGQYVRMIPSLLEVLRIGLCRALLIFIGVWKTLLFSLLYLK
jgi:hypothetical protein